MQKRVTQFGFTLIELLVVISIIALLIGILLPALGAARRSARQAQSNTQMRGIHQSMTMFGQGNRTWFPGLNAKGKIVNEAGIGDGEDTNGGYPEARYHLMLKNEYFNGEYCISPSEDKMIWTTGNVSSQNFSYAMLKIGASAAGTANPKTEAEATNLPERVEEWRQTLNGQAAVMSDRNTGANATDQVSSIYTDKSSGIWNGGVVYNDNHVKYETTNILVTKYTANAPVNDGPDKQDNLFVPNDGFDTTTKANAAMVYQDYKTFVGQE